MRLLVDRKQIIRNALLGYGKLGNDLPAWLDPDYADAIPQRPYDPERARALLKEAGQENLTVSLATSTVGPAMLESSTLIAEQAKQAGVTIQLDNIPGDQYWNTAYLKRSFACTGWGYRPLDSQMSQGFNSSAPYNETHWKRPDFDRITNQARRTLNQAKRKALWVEAQRMLWKDGGMIVWGFNNQLDAYNAKVKGLKVSAVRPLGWYDFTDVSVA